MEEGNRTIRVDLTSEGVLKLRDVVKEKLNEYMGDYTDDTLVEYVIVLLKNGRSKDEVKSELDVFLGDNSDSFVSWLWGHLTSNVSRYGQQQELRPDGVPRTKLAGVDEAGKNETHEIEPGGDEARKTETHQIESKAKKANSGTPHGHHNNTPFKGSVSDRDDNEVLPPVNSVDRNEISKNEPYRRVRRTKSSLSPTRTIHKKIRETEEQQPRKREVSKSTSGAPRRLLQFAVRDAVGTSRPSNAAESSRKRLRSMVSTSTGDSLHEARPQRRPRTFMSVAIKAAAEAVEDVSKTRPPRTVFDRLGHASDVSIAAYHQENECVSEAVGDGAFGVATENFDLGYYPQNDGSMLREENMSPFRETISGSVLGDIDGEGYDDIDGREWMDKSLTYDYAASAEPIEDLGPPNKTNHSASLRIASSLGMNTRKARYHGERDVSGMNNLKRALHSFVATKPEDQLMKENSYHTLASNGNANPAMIQQPPEKTREPTGLQNTGPPTDDTDSRTIFISNVHFAATKDSLSRHFNKFGEVSKVIILTDPPTGQPKGSAYIEFIKQEAADLALSLDGTSFMSRLLKIVRKTSAQPETASITTWPSVARPSPFSLPRFSRAPFHRGMPNIYRPRVPMKPGIRSFQWKRGPDSNPNGTSASTIFPAPATRGLKYVRAEAKANGS